MGSPKTPEPTKSESPKTPEPTKSEVSKTPEPSAKLSEVTDLPKTPEPLNPEVSKTPEAPVSNPEKEKSEIFESSEEAPAKAASESEDPVEATTIAPDNDDEVVIGGEENAEIPSSSSLSAAGEAIAGVENSAENGDVSSSTLQDEQELSSQQSQHQFFR